MEDQNGEDRDESPIVCLEITMRRGVPMVSLSSLLIRLVETGLFTTKSLREYGKDNSHAIAYYRDRSSTTFGTEQCRPSNGSEQAQWASVSRCPSECLQAAANVHGAALPSTITAQLSSAISPTCHCGLSEFTTQTLRRTSDSVKHCAPISGRVQEAGFFSVWFSVRCIEDFQDTQ
jgi:hypothetical protein